MRGLFKRFREDKNGFTLVEILVMLVIMSVLAVASVPSVAGFIDRIVLWVTA